MSVSWRAVILALVTVAIVVAATLMDPIPQDPEYHRFVDQRTLFGVANFLNVISNTPFLLVGVAGLFTIATCRHATTRQLRPIWLVFFLGIALTTFGSGYFHLIPGNDSLVWDRLPMTLGFMSLAAVITGEYYSATLARRLLLPLLILGIASVMYWSHTEQLGRGDLRPYAIVQFLPMLLIPLTISLYASRSELGRYVWWMVGFYFLAKLAEAFDAQIFALGQIVSGHSLKHVIAAMAPLSLLYGLQLRERNVRT
ncbi:MAG: ceramidase domain-containing protein [Gammaproteobacteria bacterium]|nr:ceramidase domain-containing protein [Gammaproteobacteria bacterium]